MGSRRERFKAWWIAARVHTLPIGASPVVVGIGLAYADGVAAVWPATAALLGAILIQVGTNFANDYYDAVKGVDRPDSEGFTRVTASGMLAPDTVKEAMILTYVAAIVLGAYLVYVGGLPILVIGLASVACGILYTGGPLPYGYRGLGDLFVFVFFGLVAVVGTYYVQAVSHLAEPLGRTVPTGTVTTEAVVAGVAMGALATAVLVINNLRDIEEDAAAGKRTLAVLIGPTYTRVEFAGLLVVAYLVPAWFALEGHLSVLVVYATLPLTIGVVRPVFDDRDTEALNTALANAGRLMLSYALTFAIVLVI